jgi:2-keto-3-deoxy-L-rhamnonate aldolase RhmA
MNVPILRHQGAALGFRQRLRERAPLLGSFIKTPSVHATEILGSMGYDFVVVDEEHGPFDRGMIDLLMLAAHAANLAGIVRVPNPASILAALDMGAAGVVVPHVDSVEDARHAVAAARYRGGSRGFSPSPRAGGYGATGFADHILRADAGAGVIVMIEHPRAVREAEAIAAVDGVDALFLGLGDLAVASGEAEADSAALRQAAGRVALAAHRAGKALMCTAATTESAAWLFELGASALVVSSDQGLLRREAASQISAFRSVHGRGGELT